MKIIALIPLFIIAFSFCHAQDAKWHPYEFDSLVSVSFPNDEVIEADTTINGRTIIRRFVWDGTTRYGAQKIRMTGLVQSSSSALDTPYQRLINGTISSNVPHKKVKKQKIVRDSYVGYRISYIDSLNRTNSTWEIYVLNDYFYTLLYIDFVNYDSLESVNFFRSIELNSDINAPQIIPEKTEDTVAYKLGQLCGAIILIGGLVFTLTRKKKKKGDDIV